MAMDANDHEYGWVFYVQHRAEDGHAYACTYFAAIQDREKATDALYKNYEVNLRETKTLSLNECKNKDAIKEQVRRVKPGQVEVISELHPPGH